LSGENISLAALTLQLTMKYDCLRKFKKYKVVTEMKFLFNAACFWQTRDLPLNTRSFFQGMLIALKRKF